MLQTKSKKQYSKIHEINIGQPNKVLEVYNLTKRMVMDTNLAFTNFVIISVQLISKKFGFVFVFI